MKATAQGTKRSDAVVAAYVVPKELGSPSIRSATRSTPRQVRGGVCRKLGKAPFPAQPGRARRFLIAYFSPVLNVLERGS